MKRSDAVNIISKELSHLVPGYDDRLADRILFLLEEAGMRPPLSTDVYEDLSGYTQYGLVDKGWEDET